MLIDIDKIIVLHNLPADVLAQSGMEEGELQSIYEDHIKRTPDLELEADRLVAKIRRISGVHSIKTRIKSPTGLIAKILRKKSEFPERDYSLEHYRDQIDDLIGVRALHLFKTDWEGIHQDLVDEWDFKEQPTAYYRDGDSLEVRQAYEENGCVAKPHKAHYRSVHYILQLPQSKKRVVTAELQVRTLFEEGWGEVDHLVRYPHQIDDEMIGYLSSLLNRAAGLADEISTITQRLSSERIESAAQIQALRQSELESRAESERLRKELAESIEKSAASEAEKKQMQKKLQDLQKRDNTSIDVSDVLRQFVERVSSESTNSSLSPLDDKAGSYDFLHRLSEVTTFTSSVKQDEERHKEERSQALRTRLAEARANRTANSNVQTTSKAIGSNTKKELPLPPVEKKESKK